MQICLCKRLYDWSVVVNARWTRHDEAICWYYQYCRMMTLIHLQLSFRLPRPHKTNIRGYQIYWRDLNVDIISSRWSVITSVICYWELDFCSSDTTSLMSAKDLELGLVNSLHGVFPWVSVCCDCRHFYSLADQCKYEQVQSDQLLKKINMCRRGLGLAPSCKEKLNLGILWPLRSLWSGMSYFPLPEPEEQTFISFRGSINESSQLLNDIA